MLSAIGLLTTSAADTNRNNPRGTVPAAGEAAHCNRR